MNSETQQIFEEQIEKLPRDVVDFLSSANWDGDLDEIGSLYNLSPDKLSDLKRETTLVLAGLVHPDGFSDNIEQEAGVQGAVRDDIVSAIEQRIFAPVRSALIDFINREDAEETIKEETPTTEAPEVKEKKSTAWKSGTAPDNLPVAEAPEYLVPSIPSKTSILESRIKGVPLHEDEGTETAHPFEEKMKRVFTAGQQAASDLTLAPVAPQAPSTARHIYDPYRETIE